MDEENMYKSAKTFWEGVPPTVSGMLDGFTQINSVDLAASYKFVQQFFTGHGALSEPHRAVDCGSGIGRVTKAVLLRVFQQVDMVDVNSLFLEEAPRYLGSQADRVDHYICSSLHEFVAERGRYDAVWCQWVLGHLTDDDLVQFFRRCKDGLTDNGLIFIKENMGSSPVSEFDEKDSAWTRPRHVWLELINKAGLTVVKEEKQKSFPRDLYDVHMFALH